jgi:hypothetical protein
VRRKKRYIILSKLTDDLPKDSEFLFQSEAGYVFRLTPRAAEKLRGNALLISGSMRKIKSFLSKSPKSQEN